MVTFVLPGPAASSDPLGSRAVDYDVNDCNNCSVDYKQKEMTAKP